MVLTPQSTAGTDSLRCLVKAAPQTPYDITVAMLAVNPLYNSSSTIGQFGVCWRESGSGKLLTYGWGTTNYPLTFSYSQWTNQTTLSGTNRMVKVSSDGFNWEPVQAVQGRTVFLTADQVGVFANSWKTSNGIPRVVSFLHWREA